MTTTTEKTTTRLCRWFGHRWHNAHTYGFVFVHGEPCIRRGCSVTRNEVPADFVAPSMSLDDDLADITESSWLERELSAFEDRGDPGAPDTRLLGAIARALGVDPGDLIRWVPTAGADQTAAIEQRIRGQIADELHAVRHRREHQPDTWFWAITHAERVVRGDD